MKLTVCTAVWNAVEALGPEAITRCVRSVASIPCEHEHLVFDGGSTDGTVAILSRLADEIPSLSVVSERDKGIYDALNKGVCAARGEWFYVLGADDFISHPDVLVKHLSSAEEDKADLSISPVETSDGWRPLKRRKIYALSSGMVYPHQGAVIRTRLLRQLGGYDTRYRIAGDYKVHLSAHLAGAKARVAWEPFAEYALAGVSADFGRVRAESAQAAAEAFGLDARESARFLSRGQLPWRVVVKTLSSPAAFTRRVGRGLLMNWIYHKRRTSEASVRYLFGFPIGSHRR